MPVRTICLTVALVLGFGAGAAAQERPERAERVQERVAARDSVRRSRQDAAPSGALLRMDTVVCRFGDVPRKGGDLTRTLGVRNEGSAPLVITRVVTSCSCLKADFAKRPIAPGATGTIRIIYQPNKSEPGSFSKVLHVYSNSADGRHVITVQGNSIEEK